MVRPQARDSEPFPGLEVVHSERAPQPSPQYLSGSRYQTQIEQDAAQKEAVVDVNDGLESQYAITKGTAQPKYLPIEHSNLPVSQVDSQSARSKRRKRMIWLTVIAVVVLGAIAGGVAGGLVSKHSKPEPQGGTSGGDATGSGSTPTSSVSATATMSGSASILTSYAFPTAVSWGYPHLELFALHDNIDPEWKYRNSTGWQPASQLFTSLGGQTAPYQLGMAATARGNTDVDIFVVGTDQALYAKYHGTDMVWGPSAASWLNFAGILLSPPTSVSWAADRLDIFVINTAFSLSQIWWDEQGWHDWYGFTSQFSWKTYAPTVISWAGNRYDIFLVGSEDQALYHRYYDGKNWEPADFEKLGGYCASRPVALSRKVNQIDVFVRGGDAGLWHISYAQSNSHWTNWTSISGDTAVQAEPEAVSSDANHIHVFAWGVDGSLLHKSYDANTDSWTPSNGFETVDGGLSGPPKAVSDAEGSVHVFANLQNGQVGHKSWNDSTKTWTPTQGFDQLGGV